MPASSTWLARVVAASSAPASRSARSRSVTTHGSSRGAWPAAQLARVVTAASAPASRSPRSSSATARGGCR